MWQVQLKNLPVNNKITHLVVEEFKTRESAMQYIQSIIDNLRVKWMIGLGDHSDFAMEEALKTGYYDFMNPQANISIKLTEEFAEN